MTNQIYTSLDSWCKRFMKLTWDTDGISYYAMINVKFKRGATFFICD